MNISQLKQLEAESINIFRDAVSQFERPILLYSIGKDSSVLAHLARKAFGTVTFNTYAGEGNGTYAVIYIPEPATATLSLLALACLAARRRRK